MKKKGKNLAETWDASASVHPGVSVSVGDGVWWWLLKVLNVDALVPTHSQIVSNYLVGEKFFLKKKKYMGSMQMHLKSVGVSSLSLNKKMNSY